MSEVQSTPVPGSSGAWSPPVGAHGIATVGRLTSRPTEGVRAFIDASFAAFERALACDGSEHKLSTAGRTLRVRFAGSHLTRRFLPALQHLATDAGQADLTICCWDGNASPVAMPPPPWPSRDFVGGSRIRGHINGPVVATYDRDGRLFQLYDRPSRRALFHVADGARLPGWHDRAPFRPFLSLWADDHGLALLHGAAVAEGGAGLVLAGVSGSGKSTTALRCALAGMDFLGDDACLVDPAGATVHSVYGRAKILHDAATATAGAGAGAGAGADPDLGAGLGDVTGLGPVERDGGDGVVLSPRRVGREATLGALLLLRVADQRQSELSAPIPERHALEALQVTLREENHGLTPACCQALEAVVGAVTVRRLTLGFDGTGIVEAVRSALAASGGAGLR
ncbi:MAG TPA: hypothetical protein VHT30_09405 [Acidimicrobiales bacterium]|nr:hypothetical protein [Acidimicrobiales bacterium]